MVKPLELRKQRKPLRPISKEDVISTAGKPLNSYFYPKNNLYTRQEFELLDTLYSDEPPTIKEDVVLIDDFWPQNKEEFLKMSDQKKLLLTKISWFLLGVMLTSAIWFIFFQFKLYETSTKENTKIVFHKTAQIVTHETADKEITKQLQSKNQGQTKVARSFKLKLPSLFTRKPTTKVETPVVPLLQEKYHTVGSGDSIWVIAQKYYSNPSPDNINKILKANKLKQNNYLQPGQKIVIPQ